MKYLNLLHKFLFLLIVSCMFGACNLKKDNTNIHEAIDLGLPSGVKWATCNIGASSPEEYGDYYAWSEIEEKNDYSWTTYNWCNGTGNSMTKYCTSNRCGTVDNRKILAPKDDVAHVKWGGSWRMPTINEFNELRSNCTWQWITQNGVNGQLVTGPNGNSIFLPAAGYRYGTGIDNCGSYGYYWSATLGENNSGLACGLSFYKGSRGWNDSGRYYGHSVRPVTDK